MYVAKFCRLDAHTLSSNNFRNLGRTFYPTLPFLPFRPIGMMGEACYPSNAYYSSGVYVCWFDHSDLSFGNGFMTSDYGLGSLTSTLYSL